MENSRAYGLFVIVGADIECKLPIVLPAVAIVDLAVALLVVTGQDGQDEGKKGDGETHGEGV